MATPLADIARMADLACGGRSIVRGVGTTEEFVAAALDRLNDVAPQRGRLTITGTGADEYTLDTATWVQNESTIERADFYASGDFGETPRTMDPAEYDVYVSSAGVDQVRFGSALATGDKVVLHVRAPHTLTSAATSLAASDYRALGDLAAALKLEASAVAILGVIQQGSDEDVANLGTNERAELLTARAAACRKRFNDHYGIASNASTGAAEIAAAASVDVDPHSGFPGGRWHTHARRGAGL